MGCEPRQAGWLLCDGIQTNPAWTIWSTPVYSRILQGDTHQKQMYIILEKGDLFLRDARYNNIRGRMNVTSFRFIHSAITLMPPYGLLHKILQVTSDQPDCNQLVGQKTLSMFSTWNLAFIARRRKQKNYDKQNIPTPKYLNNFIVISTFSLSLKCWILLWCYVLWKLK